MKNTKKTIKELAIYFDKELQSKLPISVLPNGDLVYKNFLVKQLSNSNWGVFNINNKDLVNQYFLKSCALMAAKAYNHRQLAKCSEIKSLDDSYWSNFSDCLYFKNNITQTDDERYEILLTRLEESTYQTELHKRKIFTLFRYTFS